MKNLKPNEVAEKLNVTVRTLQRWDSIGLLVANRAPSNRRYYTEDQIQDFNYNTPEFDLKTSEILVNIKKAYSRFDNENLNAVNIQGHIISEFCKMMRMSDMAFENYGHEFNREKIYYTCDILVGESENRNCVFSIVSTDADNGTDNILNHFKNAGCDNGFIINKYEWTLVKNGDVVCKIDFSKDVSIKDFEKFCYKKMIKVM